mmetsp:Transcript_14673/g.27584  ORF Transcript_14673/g.27584 Transcript_14673/m.27584 type:complete len:200 (+) Transcript_14673:310-909(+)
MRLCRLFAEPCADAWWWQRPSAGLHALHGCGIQGSCAEVSDLSIRCSPAGLGQHEFICTADSHRQSGCNTGPLRGCHMSVGRLASAVGHLAGGGQTSDRRSGAGAAPVSSSGGAATLGHGDPGQPARKNEQLVGLAGATGPACCLCVLRCRQGAPPFATNHVGAIACGLWRFHFQAGTLGPSCSPPRNMRHRCISLPQP